MFLSNYYGKYIVIHFIVTYYKCFCQILILFINIKSMFQSCDKTSYLHYEFEGSVHKQFKVLQKEKGANTK